MTVATASLLCSASRCGRLLLDTVRPNRAGNTYLVSFRKLGIHFFFAQRNKNIVIQCFDCLAIRNPSLWDSREIMAFSPPGYAKDSAIQGARFSGRCRISSFFITFWKK
jgi:hypothetical protein